MTDESTQADFDEARRNRTIWTILILLGVLVAAGALALGWDVIEGRLTAARQLDRAASLLKGTDEFIIAADEVIRADVSPETATKAVKIAPLVERTRSQLAEANALAGAGFDRLTDDEQRQARLIQGAAKARFEMLDAAAATLSAAERAATVEEIASEAWAKTLAADELALRAVADYNAATSAGVKKALVANREARVGFAKARLLYRQADLVFPEAKLGAFVTYIDARLALVALSKQVDDAWLAGRIAQANRLMASSAKMNGVAAEAARQLPGSPATAVTDAYRTLADTPSGAYYKARQKAVEAGEALKSL